MSVNEHEIDIINRAFDRDCKNCKHYVKANEGNTEVLFGELYACEKWDCKFELKGKVSE